LSGSLNSNKGFKPLVAEAKCVGLNIDTYERSARCPLRLC